VRRDRRARIERRADRRAVGLTAGMLLLAACTGGGHPAPEPSPTAPALTPKGSLLVDVGREFPSLALLPLGTLGAPQPVDLTGSLLGRFDFPGGAQLLADGTAYLLVTKVDGSLGFRTRELGSQIFELSRGHEPRKVGPPLGPVSPSLVGVAGGRVVISTCGGRHRPPSVMTLDLGTGDADGTWQPVVRACLAALSPNGTDVAFVRPGERGPSIWRVPLDRSTPPVMLAGPDVLAPLQRSGVGRPDVFSLAWGEGGVAAAVADRREDVERSGLVVLPDGSRPRVVSLGSGRLVEMAWQPGGDLLALTECSRCAAFFRRVPQGELLMFDASSGRLREVAASRDTFRGLAWSPDGSLLATEPSQGDLTFLDVTGREVGSLATDGAPLDWGAG